VATIAYAGPPVAISLLMTGDHDRAEAVLDDTLAATRALGNRRHASRALWALGLVALRRGEPARALIEEACVLGGEFGDHVFLTFAIPELARAHIAEGGPEPAVRLLAAASAFRAATGAAPVVWFQDEHERTIETARAALGEDRFAAVWREGEAMTPDEAFASARDATGDPPPDRGVDVPQPEELTAREAEVLTLVARGLTDAQVAAELVLSRRTVHAHLRAVYRKLDVGSRHAATRWALEHGVA
jgi:DNA-binding CsgD family transcriptional regulator